MNKKQVSMLIISLVIIGGGVGIYFLVQSFGAKITEAPDYQLQSITGANFTLSSLLPKTIILDFMSITCVPCKTMYPRLANLFEDDELSMNITIISIETDNTTTIPQLTTYATEQNMTWTVVIAPENITLEFGVVSLPTFVIINPEGKITYFQEGVVSFDTLKEESLKAIEGISEEVAITSYQGFLIGFAIIVAITSFFSPCSFPLLPSYVAHIIGVDLEEDKEEEIEVQETKMSKIYYVYPLLGLSGGLGILVSYLILGVIISAVGNVIQPYLIYVLPVLGGLFIVFGILMFTNYEISFSRLLGWIRKGQMKVEKGEKRFTFSSKIFSTFLYGLGYGIASLGCNGPIFIGFSMQVSLEPTIMKMIYAYLAFSLTIIFLMIAVTVLLIFSREVIIQKLKASTKMIKQISGAILILVAIYLFIEFAKGIS